MMNEICITTSTTNNGTTPWRSLALLIVAAALGCGGSTSYDVAPVSGVVTLDGQPVPEAHVVFQPIGGEDNLTPGPSSSGQADSQGRFELKTIRDEPGAVVGNHRVLITTPRPEQDWANDSGIGAPVHKEIIPARYNENSGLTFDVPADGTTTADFKLTTEP
jgi:hypothetical protein